jgi:hypothetical protein
MARRGRYQAAIPPKHLLREGRVGLRRVDLDRLTPATTRPAVQAVEGELVGAGRHQVAGLAIAAKRARIRPVVVAVDDEVRRVRSRVAVEALERRVGGAAWSEALDLAAPSVDRGILNPERHDSSGGVTLPLGVRWCNISCSKKPHLTPTIESKQ